MLLELRQHSKSLIVIPGTDCELIQDWNKVKNFVASLPDARITRLDVAIDIKDNLTLRQIDQAYADGQFSQQGHPPGIQHIGQFVSDDGQARTINIGKRQHGKCLRIYEIGRKLQLDCQNSIRLEVEFNGGKRIIPLDALLDPNSYFCGAYPFLKQFHNGKINTTDLRTKVRSSTYLKKIEHLKHSYGQFINVMLEIEESNEVIIRLISRPGFPQNFSIDQIALMKASISKSLPGAEIGAESMHRLPPMAIKIIDILGSAVCGKQALAEALGKTKPNRYLNVIVRSMLTNGLIKYTIPKKPNSRLQEYKLTKDGIVILEDIGRSAIQPQVVLSKTSPNSIFS